MLFQNWRQCEKWSNFAKIKHRCVKAWLYFNGPNQRLSANKICKCKILSFHEEGWKPVIENLRRCCRGWIVFTHEAVVDDNFVRKWKIRKSVVGIHINQMYPHSMCQETPTGFSLCVNIWLQKWLDSHLDKTKRLALGIRSFPIFEEQNLIVSLKISTRRADRSEF